MANRQDKPPNTASIAVLLPKLSDADPDFRYMSLNDLFNTLNAANQNVFSGDHHTCGRTVDGIVKTLDDQNGEVQNLAMKWYTTTRYSLGVKKLTCEI